MKTEKNIEILRIHYLKGPNIWTYRPVIEAWVDIGTLEDFPSNTIPGFYDRLVHMLPGLIEHHCSPGVRGGFLQRLEEGTWAAHILEHVCLELQNLASLQVSFGKARETSKRGVYKIAFRTRQEEIGRSTLVLGRELLLAAINNTPYTLEPQLKRLREQVDALCLGPSTSHIVDAAVNRNIPFIRLTSGNLVQLGYGKAQRRIWTAETDKTSAIAEEIASDKDLTKSLLKSCGVPVPEGTLVDSPQEAWVAAQEIGVPVAVKPYDGNHGRGVSLELYDQPSIEAAFHVAKAQSSGHVIVEKFIGGNEHRLLVVGNAVVAAARGESAWVVGDGVSCVSTLVETQLNVDPRRGVGEDTPLNVIDLENNPEVTLELQRVGLSQHAIPAQGQRVLIQRNGNVDCDVTDEMHHSVARVATLAARVVGLDIAGIDMVLQDISQPMDTQIGAVIEVNASPGLLAHIKPAKGQTRPVGKAIVEHLFPGDTEGRIPIVGITGTQQLARIARLVAWMVHISGKHVGLACSEGFFLDSRKVSNENCATWYAGQRLLTNRSLQAAVLENPSQTILAEGLAYDKCCVGIVTDVGWEESLQEFDILDVEQTYKVTRTQVDVILPSGTAVLHAADPLVVQLADLCDGKVIFYALNSEQTVITQHRANGERVVFLRNQDIVLAQGAHEVALLPLSNLGTTQAFDPRMIMAAIAAAWALNIPVELMDASMRTFASNLQNI